MDDYSIDSIPRDVRWPIQPGSPYECPNCGWLREVQDDMTVSKCRSCGDDEIDLAKEIDVP